MSRKISKQPPERVLRLSDLGHQDGPQRVTGITSRLYPKNHRDSMLQLNAGRGQDAITY